MRPALLIALGLAAAAHAAQPSDFTWSCSGGTCSGTVEASYVGGIMAYHQSGTSASLPSVTIRMERCTTYKLTLKNNLDEQSSIHTHGLHVSGDAPGDNVIHGETGSAQDPRVPPGNSFTYEYKIPCDHASGTFWYHPHTITTSNQLKNGLSGALIIEGNAGDEEQLPSWLTDMREYVVLAQSDTGKTNGLDSETVSMAVDEWVRFRIVHSADSASASFSLPNGCDARLIAKDGVYLSAAPRTVTGLFEGNMASRADVAVKCRSSGSYTASGSRLTFSVSGSCSSGLCGSDMPADETWAPCRPVYLEDLRSANNLPVLDLTSGIKMKVDFNGCSGTFGDEQAIECVEGNGQNTFVSDKLDLQVNTKYEMPISGANGHPVHIHVNHFQLQTAGNQAQDPSGNWAKPGDWLDTLSGNELTRMNVDSFTGKMVVHCHISGHSDGGAVAYWKIAGNGISGSGLQTRNTFTCPAGSPGPAPTPEPTPEPTTPEPTPEPTTAPSCGGRNAICASNDDCCSMDCDNRRGKCSGNRRLMFL